MEWEYQVGDIVAIVGASQLYFHFPTDEWYNLKEGDLGFIVARELNDFGNAYLVKLFKHSKSVYWMYDDELELISEHKNER